MTEILIGMGRLLRRYDSLVHTAEILETWRPMVSRMLDHPAERHYHAMVGLPYWEASMALPQRYAHPAAPGPWLAFHCSPSAEWPFYVGCIILPGSHPAETDANLLLLAAMTGGGKVTLADVGAFSFPLLAGGYHLGGLPKNTPDAKTAMQSTGECAAILAQLVGEALSK